MKTGKEGGVEVGGGAQMEDGMRPAKALQDTFVVSNNVESNIAEFCRNED